MDNRDDLNRAMLNAQKTSALVHALSFAWVELPGCEVELMLEMTAEYADSATEYLISLSGEVKP